MPTTSPVPQPTDPAAVPLTAAPTEALAFTLGFVAARPVTADQYGSVTALAEELMRRGAWTPILASLPPELSRALGLLYQAHRGQRWARTGQYRPMSGNS